jgi:hypothetical protein
MDDHSDFDSVSWRDEGDSARAPTNAILSPPESPDTTLPSRTSKGKRRLSAQQSSNEVQAGSLAEPVDLGGIGDGVLECTVDSPLKESDGTKDAFVSYLISIKVSPLLTLTGRPANTHTLCNIDRFQVLSEIKILSPQAFYRFPLPTANPLSRIPGMRNSSLTGEEQHGLRTRGPFQR